MNKQDKEILLKDLCARLPYRVKVKSSRRRESTTLSLAVMIDFHLGYSVKPFLRPMSSMTKEEFSEVKRLFGFEITTSLGKTYIDDWKQGLNEINYTIDLIDWLNAHHLDYRGLIKKGLALEAPEEMYKL